VDAWERKGEGEDEEVIEAGMILQPEEVQPVGGTRLVVAGLAEAPPLSPRAGAWVGDGMAIK